MKNYRNFGLILFIIFVIIFKAEAQFYSADYITKKTKDEGLAEATVIGSGELQKSISENKDFAASTGIGLMYWRIWPESEGSAEMQLDLVINVASTVDTLIAKTDNNLITNNRRFGNYVLAPAIGGQSTEINAVFYFKDKNIYTTKRKTIAGKGLTYIDGLQFNFFGANEIWRYDSTFQVSDTVFNTRTRLIDVFVAGWKAGMFYDFIKEDVRRTKGFSVRLGTSYIGRAVKGDGGIKDKQTTDLREKFLLNRMTTHHGVEFSFVVRFGNITAKALMPMMIVRSDDPVPGLSGVQFITSIGFVGGLPKFDLKL